MFCMCKRTVLFSCVLVVSLGNVAGYNWPKIDPISLLPTTATCGIQNNERIISGERTDIDEHPWLVLILSLKPGVGLGAGCGGSLISERYVLTAAHCVHPNNLLTGTIATHVVLGEWDMSTPLDCVEGDCSPPPQIIPIEETIIHEGYKPDDVNHLDDIALLRLDRNAQFNDFVKPICLAPSNELGQDSFLGEDLEISGWGATANANYSDVKLKARVSVISLSQCANYLQKLNRILKVTNKQICAGGLDGRTACHGDSGGPLMGRAPPNNNWIVVGIVSTGNCIADSPVTFTRVGAYIDWIFSKLKP